jgi:hypothetical protein
VYVCMYVYTGMCKYIVYVFVCVYWLGTTVKSYKFMELTMDDRCVCMYVCVCVCNHVCVCVCIGWRPL